MSRNVRITRTAISPRLATRTVLNIPSLRSPLVSKSREVMSHPEDAVGHRLQRSLCNNRKCQPQYGSGVGGVDDAVVPEPCGGVVRVALVLVLLADRRLERLFLVRGHVAANGGEDRRGLLATHHRDPGVRPHPEEPWRVGPATHRVVARTVGAADYDRQ